MNPETCREIVVGVSFYQKALEEICDGRLEGGKYSLNVKAQIIPEDGNPHDEYAVKVIIRNKLVGYLSRKIARVWRSKMITEGFSGAVTCPAKIKWDRVKQNEGSYGVWLDIDLTLSDSEPEINFEHTTLDPFNRPGYIEFLVNKLNRFELLECKVGDEVNLWVAEESNEIIIYRQGCDFGEGEIGICPDEFFEIISERADDANITNIWENGCKISCRLLPKPETNEIDSQIEDNENESTDVFGWSSAVWGMTEEEILQLFKPDAKKLRRGPDVEYSNPKRFSTVGILDIIIAGRSCTTHFFFDNKNGLNEIIIKPTTEFPHGYFESFYELLTQEYGSATSTNKDGTKDIAVWLFPSTIVKLTRDDAWPLNLLFVTIHYRPNISNEMIEKSINKTNDSKLYELNSIVRQTELMLSKIEEPSYNYNASDQEKIDSLIDVIYRSAIRSFLTSTHNSYFKHMSLKMETYTTISPLIKNWNKNLETINHINEKYFEDFIEDLNIFSINNPDFTFDCYPEKETYNLSRFFEEKIWKQFLKKEADSARVLCNKMLKIKSEIKLRCAYCNTLDSHHNINGTAIYTCFACGNNFKYISGSTFTVPQNTFTNVKCAYCDTMSRHMVPSYTDKPIYLNCQSCGRKFICIFDYILNRINSYTIEE